MLGAFEAALHAGQTLTNDDFASNLTVEQLDEKIELFEAEQKELRESILQQVEEDQEGGE